MVFRYSERRERSNVLMIEIMNRAGARLTVCPVGNDECEEWSTADRGDV